MSSCGYPFASAVPCPSPDRPAVRRAGREVGYRELDELADALAARIAPGQVVAVSSRDRLDYVVGLLAVLRAGGVYLPLDPDAPADRTELLLADSGAALLVADGVPAARGRQAVDVPAARGCLFYTSGTTGRPKGVLVPTSALAAHVTAVTERFGLCPQDVVLQYARPTVDVFLEQVTAALAAGACLVLPERQLMAPGELLDLLATERVTVANLSAGHFRELTAALSARAWRPGPLRLMVSGSDRLHPGTAADWHRHTGVPLLNAYGPTETVVTATVHPVAPDDAAGSDGAVPIGNVVGDRAARVLDERLRPCPPGTPGELYLGGDVLAAGYWGDPARTAERFLPDPHADTPGARLYRTGDLVRQRADGALEFLGRTDDQLKIRGFRVEPGEVEAALASCPGVTACAVTGHEGRLAAYVTGAPETVPDHARVREHLAARLPEHLLPATSTVLDSFPLTDRGKIDRRALPAPGGEAAPRGTTPPTTPAEQVIAAVWSEALGVSGVGREDNFFHLGGDSLTAVRVVGRVFDVFGPVSPYTIFEAPELAAFAAAVGGTDGGDRAPLTAAGHDRAPLSKLQRGLWFLEQWNPGTTTYSVPWVFRFDRPMDPALLHAALESVAARHESLRTVFRLDEDGPRQYVRSEAVVPFEVAEAPAERVPRLIEEAVARPLDLADGPPLRAHFFPEGPAGESVLLLIFHHIVWDEGSLPVLERELAESYAALREGRRPRAAGPPVQYADFSAWQYADPEHTEAQLSYWAEQLAGAPEGPALPPDRTRPATQAFRGACHTFAMPDSLARAVRELARDEDATPYMVLLAGLASALRRRSGETDLVIGSPVSTRNRAELNDLIGYFVNLLPLRLRPAPELSFRELVRHVREVCLGAYRHQDASFDEIVDRVLTDPPQDRNPLCQVLLEQHPLGERPLTIGDATVTRALYPHPVARFDLSVSVDDRGSGFTGRFEYDRDLFDAATMAELCDDWLTVLAAGTGLPVHRLFEIQADRTPEATALLFDGGRLDYAGLNTGANRLAHVLAARGVGRGSLVALLTERGPELVTGLLAVLKTGAAYTLLDPDFPAARLADTITDCGADLVLTHGRVEPPPLPEGGPPRLALEELAAEVAAAPGDDPGLPAGAEDLACVMFTSGSTGRPKGVAVPHRALTATYPGQEYARFGPEEVWLQCSPVSWDAFALELYGALLFGGVCVLQPGRRADPQLIAELTRRHGVTQLQLSAGLFNFLVEEYPEAFDGPHTVFTAGERASGPHVAKVLAAHPRLRVGNGYGPVESLGFTTCHPVTPADTATASVPIGRPLAGKDILVLDDGLRPVAPGETGELYAAGGGLAHGYLGRPALTAERFVARPGGRPGERLYRTGDLGRVTADGTLEIIGRADDQVKVNGFRVEPGEIEDALTRHPRVREGAVAVRTADSGEHRIAAYITTGPDGADPEEVLRWLSERLPAHLLPATCDLLDALPLNPNGKTDRTALPAPRTPAQQPPEDGPGDGLTGDERLVAEAMRTVLGHRRIRPEDNFFRIGGNSLAAVRVAMHLSRATGARIRPQLVFQARTVRAIARQLPAADTRRTHDARKADAS
ncbi:amino acid adenylation domain-containing protein [Streptomyces sp. TRM43335]|uniref:Amino acid adenylation domain-containing protein n=1 Tax=Streptomyces taklimakanensis TaxID=2569853 RepID=A0A6G2BJV4_9ACTN|nr:non-ribosomal peptide synthetase [Streptomyces taklimakanensis]MTE22396.1 amino acid adenylation domain-containing protein [Streptomyces taklimakanensis]